jgi:type IV pilus assembly protein PilO
MTVTGDYHQFAKFLEGLSVLPRIVTVHDTKMGPIKNGSMTMQLQAKTYRYFDESGQ